MTGRQARPRHPELLLRKQPPMVLKSRVNRESRNRFFEPCHWYVVVAALQVGWLAPRGFYARAVRILGVIFSATFVLAACVEVRDSDVGRETPPAVASESPAALANPSSASTRPSVGASTISIPGGA